jgi:RimJ/RimL family protein N-acetyltransferase
VTQLVETRDEDFAWMLGGPASRADLVLPPGGVEAAETLAMVRHIHAVARGAGRGGAWMMTQDGEVVGLCGAAGPSDEAQEMEIGYSVAPRRRRRGHATRAVAAMIALARSDGALSALTAVTAQDNRPSQTVLTANGFVETGRETREDDGPVILWRLELG